MADTYRLNVTLSGEHAAKLTRLAERTHVQEGTLARSLLSSALDDADPDAENVVALLDGMPGALERAKLGLEQSRAGETVSLDDLAQLARVELSKAAVEDLHRLIRAQSLPADTVERVRRSLRPLEQFPLMGGALAGRWAGFRFLLGPWRWLILVYVYVEEENRAVVVAIQDARTSSAARP